MNFVIEQKISFTFNEFIYLIFHFKIVLFLFFYKKKRINNPSFFLFICDCYLFFFSPSFFMFSSYTVCLEFYHKMILSIIDISTTLKHELTARINDQYSWMNNNLSLNCDMKNSEQERMNELKGID